MFQAREIIQAMVAAAERQPVKNLPIGCLTLPKKYRESDSYGRWKIGQDNYRAHRLMYVLVNGMIPDTRVVMHKCDNPPCIEMQHLVEGTQADNTRDAQLKGRLAYGERAGRVKLTEAECRVIFKLATEYGTPQRHLARIFCVHHKSIQRLLNGEKWKHLGLVKSSDSSVSPS